jgi:hypothetical protein
VVGAVIDPVEEHTFLCQQGLQLVVNEAQLPLCALPASHYWLIGHEDSAVIVFLKQAQRRDDTRQQVKVIGIADVTTVPYKCSITVEKYGCLGNVEACPGDRSASEVSTRPLKSFRRSDIHYKLRCNVAPKQCPISQHSWE